MMDVVISCCRLRAFPAMWTQKQWGLLGVHRCINTLGIEGEWGESHCAIYPISTALPLHAPALPCMAMAPCFSRLASFSVSQLDAFSALYWGDCPYLSRAIRLLGWLADVPCVYNGLHHVFLHAVLRGLEFIPARCGRHRILAALAAELWVWSRRFFLFLICPRRQNRKTRWSAFQSGRGEMGTVSFSRLQRLVSAYLDEEAALAQRQALATSHSQLGRPCHLVNPCHKSNITIRDPKIKRNSLFVGGAALYRFVLLCIAEPTKCVQIWLRGCEHDATCLDELRRAGLWQRWTEAWNMPCCCPLFFFHWFLCVASIAPYLHLYYHES